jgi:pimeloyl-ACP methyl ester carboxylesterase
MRYSILFLFIACGPGGSGTISSSKESNSSAAAVDARRAALSPALTLADLPVQMDAPIAGTFTQDIDHPTSGTDTVGTFTQRYWYSTEFASGPDAPVIYTICGEAECDPWYVQEPADVAASLGASVVTLEHRYYGPSQPFADESKAHMKYLTIHNALEDLASFQRWAQQNLPLTGKWIAVGGSYSGALAAFYRETHPELVVGAWASSSPVNIQLAFAGYDQNAAQTLGPTCTLHAARCSLFRRLLLPMPRTKILPNAPRSRLSFSATRPRASGTKPISSTTASLTWSTAPPPAKAKVVPTRGFPHIDTHVAASTTDFARIWRT